MMMKKRTVVMAVASVIVFAGLAGCAAKAVYTVNCGDDEAYVDTAGKKWAPDQEMAEGADWGYVEGSEVVRDLETISHTPSPRVYLTERYSMTAYEFKLKEGRYTVRLHFAETYDGITAAGERLFAVSLNGKAVLKDLDVFKEAGGPNKPLVKEFTGVAVKGGKLVIAFEPNVQNPEINGIEILAE